MKKYSHEELKELAKGVFNDDKESAVIYADDSGTFRNPKQMAEMKARDKGEEKAFCYEFKSPHVKEQKEESGKKEADARIAELETKVADLQGKLSIAESQRDSAGTAAAEGSKKIAALQGQLDEAAEEINSLRQDSNRIKSLESDLDAANKELNAAKKQITALEKKASKPQT